MNATLYRDHGIDVAQKPARPTLRLVMYEFALGLSPPVHIQVPIQDCAGVLRYPESRFPGICALCQCDEYNVTNHCRT